jgi:hypothetical protein
MWGKNLELGSHKFGKKKKPPPPPPPPPPKKRKENWVYLVHAASKMIWKVLLLGTKMASWAY